MTKYKALSIILLVIIMQTSKSFSDASSNHYRTLDPMMDFAAPQSLTECLHEGLIAVDGILQGAAGQSSNVSSLLTGVSSELIRLNDAYDSMIGRSKINRIYNDDSEFLQKMIDRIDLMIQELERSVNLSDEDGEVLQENIQLVGQLRSKLGM